MNFKPLPPIDYIRERLDYKLSTGEFTWRDHPDLANQCKPGDVAGCIKKDSGYRFIGIKGVQYRAHRLAWAWIYRFDPSDYGPMYRIDHIDGDRSDNRIANLRIVTHAENQRNQKISSSNNSGHTGVCWHKASGKWNARIMVNGKTKNLGLFTNLDNAVAAREAANEQYGYHENHGRKSA